MEVKLRVDARGRASPGPSMTEERPSLAAVRTKGGASHPRIAFLKVRVLSRGR